MKTSAGAVSTRHRTSGGTAAWTLDAIVALAVVAANTELGARLAVPLYLNKKRKL